MPPSPQCDAIELPPPHSLLATPRALGLSTPRTNAECLVPRVEKITDLRDRIESLIELSLGELQAENEELRQRLAVVMDSSVSHVERSSFALSQAGVEPKLVSFHPGDVSRIPHELHEKEKQLLCYDELETRCLVAGTYVRLKDLKSKPELNGQPGILLDFDEQTGRWNVIMRDGSGLSLKPDNLGAEEMIHKSFFQRFLQHSKKMQAAAVHKALDEGMKSTLTVLSQQPILSSKESLPFLEKSTVQDLQSIENGGITAVGLKRGFTTPVANGEQDAVADDKGNVGSNSIRAALHDNNVNANNETLKVGVFADAGAMKDKVREAIYKKPYNVSDFYYDKGWAQRVARSSIFDQMTVGIIALNAVWIGVDTEFNTAPTLLEADPFFLINENIFCVYFFSEWCIRFLAFEHKINGLRDRWFIFDSMLVLFMVLETWVMTLVLLIGGGAMSGGVGNASILRLVRLLRLTRMARMARLLRAMPELMILVKALFAAFRSVFFTICLLMLLVYVFAVAFVQLAAHTSIGDEYFHGVLSAMYNLLLIGNLPDHAPFVSEVSTESVFFGVMLFTFIFLGPLAIMGMLAGVLVEVVSVVSSVERETMVVNYVTEQLNRMLCEVDLDGDKILTRQEFQDFVVRPDAARMMASVGVDVVGLAEYCDFLFADSDGITFSSFVDLVLQLRGSNQATVKDVVDMRKFMRQELSKLVVKELTGVERRILAKVPKETVRMISSQCLL